MSNAAVTLDLRIDRSSLTRQLKELREQINQATTPSRADTNLQKTAIGVNNVNKSQQELNKTKRQSSAINKDLNSSLTHFNRNIMSGKVAVDALILSTKRFVATYIGLYGAIKTYRATVAAGLDFNRFVENAQMGMAAMMSSNASMIDSNGNLLSSYEQFNTGLAQSTEILDQLREASGRTAASFREMTELYQQLIGTTLGMGDAFGQSMDEISDNTIQMITQFTNFGAAVGIPMRLMQNEIRSLAEGTTDRNSRMAVMLFGSATAANKAIRDVKDDVNGVFNLFSERMQAFTLLEGADTIDMIFARIRNQFDTIRGEATQGLFEQYRRGLLELLRVLEENEDSLKALVRGLGVVITELATAIGAVAKAALWLYDTFKSFFDLLGGTLIWMTKIGVAGMALVGGFKLVASANRVIAQHMIYQLKLMRMMNVEQARRTRGALKLAAAESMVGNFGKSISRGAMFGPKGLAIAGGIGVAISIAEMLGIGPSTIAQLWRGADAVDELGGSFGRLARSINYELSDTGRKALDGTLHSVTSFTTDASEKINDLREDIRNLNKAIEESKQIQSLLSSDPSMATGGPVSTLGGRQGGSPFVDILAGASAGGVPGTGLGAGLLDVNRSMGEVNKKAEELGEIADANLKLFESQKRVFQEIESIESNIAQLGFANLSIRTKIVNADMQKNDILSNYYSAQKNINELEKEQGRNNIALLAIEEKIVELSGDLSEDQLDLLDGYKNQKREIEGNLRLIEAQKQLQHSLMFDASGLVAQVEAINDQRSSYQRNVDTIEEMMEKLLTAGAAEGEIAERSREVLAVMEKQLDILHEQEELRQDMAGRGYYIQLLEGEEQLRTAEEEQHTLNKMAIAERYESETAAYQNAMALEDQRHRKAIQHIDEMERKQSGFWGGFEWQLKQMNDEWEEFWRHGAHMAEYTSNRMTDAFAEVYDMFLEGSVRAGDAFKAFAKDVIREIFRIYAARVATGLVFGAGQMIGGGGADAPASSGGAAPAQVHGMVSTGGVTRHGGRYLVGEQGPEIVNLPGSASVIPNNKIHMAGAGGGAANVVVNVINQSGQDMDASEQSTEFDGERYIINVVMKAHRNNQGGFRDALRAR